MSYSTFYILIFLFFCFSTFSFNKINADELKSASSNNFNNNKNDLTFLKKRDSLMDDIRRVHGDDKIHDLSDNDSKSNEKKDIDDNDSKSQYNKRNKSENKLATFGFLHAFFASLSVIVVSEIGDKTFFIAAIMAMKHSRSTVYIGAMLALGLMTLLSALLGNIITNFIPRSYTYYLSSLLFAIFGLKMLHEGWHMDHNDATEEYEEANSALKENDEKNEQLNPKDIEAGGGGGGGLANEDSAVCNSRRFINIFRKYLSPIFLQAFILTFLAEWGDRSQISTIILGARENMFGTVLGGVLGHGACTGLAVLGGRLIAQRISVRTVTLTGAFVFLFFALSAFFVDPNVY